MARTNIPMVINLRQNKNDESSAYGKYFAEVDTKEPLNLKGFAKHMTSHGKIADYQMCVLVLGQVVDCMSTESVMPSNHLILCHTLLSLPSIFPSIRAFSNE